ncbi:hypothetical protein ACH40F_16460 [Streptomyces sp. NPDC020794]|uniref:hypothetical protein n=1 Tax=unclassified Streptomyces TaxID=2593676 RepID=UPI0036E1FA74
MTVALQEFDAILRQVRALDSDASDEAVELRRVIRFLGLSEGRLVEARRMLEPLHAHESDLGAGLAMSGNATLQAISD